ncbi:hypothetical protein CBA19CS11_37910 [Caballeronia novacaledonica]|uniref:patatin-like phospholipase family protein n=1 Tax=Caballeronia novacaledonica TaxID=1544861 RepID=UPI001EE165F4|nr:patatin-like phospholipase family protein [Caballeronia novacaledonica]GJH14742.1 hypothetical protein CBA19CS11_37910 [Caballeronia novacaledonica]
MEAGSSEDLDIHRHLCGLALSGGGVRSATFCLGALQGFVEADAYRYFDYLSTVSGGGYIGCTLTTSLSGDRASTAYADPPISIESASPEEEPEIVKHLRNYSKYLAPTGKDGSLNIIALVLLGFSINILLILPALIFISFAILFVSFAHIGLDNWVFVIIAFFLGWAAIYSILVSRTEESDESLASRPNWLRLTVFFLGMALLFAFLRIQPYAMSYLVWLPIPEHVFADALQWVLGSLGALGAFFGLIGYLLNRFGRRATKVLLVSLGLIAPVILWFIVLAIASTLTNACSWHTFERFSGLRIVEFLRAFSLSHRYFPLVYPSAACFDSIQPCDACLDPASSSTVVVAREDLYSVAATYLVVSLVLITLAWIVDVNSTSLHAFYRDRLRDAFLWHDKTEKQRLKLSEVPDIGPYHLLNAAINIQNSEQNLRGRNAKTFIFSKLFCGSDITGWCRTKALEDVDPQLDLAAAMAISGAAVAPNQGVATNRPLRFLMALANARLGYWLINPLFLNSHIDVSRRVSPYFFFLELFGRLDEKQARVYVSDGGHIENLGAYELLRRRCKYIVVIDAENDTRNFFHGLAHLIRIARIDFNCVIDIDLQDLRRNELGVSSSHCAMGTIQYANKDFGELLYIKASLTGDETEYIREYQTRFTDFPHESTTDQFFTEEQFEAYRALGAHVAQGILQGHHGGIDKLFLHLREVLFVDVIDKTAYLEVQTRLARLHRLELAQIKSEKSNLTKEAQLSNMERKIELMEFAVVKLRLNERRIAISRCGNVLEVLENWLKDESFRFYVDLHLSRYGDDLRRFVVSSSQPSRSGPYPPSSASGGTAARRSPNY